jgi:hypothetical protein
VGGTNLERWVAPILKGGWHQLGIYLERWVAPIGDLAILGGQFGDFQYGGLGSECRLRRSIRAAMKLSRHPARMENKEESES